MAPLDSTARKQLPVSVVATPPHRAAPHSIEAEQALLGAILINNEAFYRVSDFLKPQHFFEPIHGQIFQLAGDLIHFTKPANPLTLKTFLPPDLDIAGMNVNQYLARLAAEATTIINAKDYGQLVYDLALRRDLINIGETLVNTAYNSQINESPQNQIEEAERQLFELAETGKFGRGFHEFKTALRLALDMASAAHQRDGGLSGLATDLIDLDMMLGGLQKSDLIVLAGRPGMGKTALATNIAYKIASKWEGETTLDGHLVTKNGGIVGFFSLEMSAEQLATRIVSEQTEIPSNEIRRGKISPQKFDALAAAAADMERAPLYIDESGGITIAQLAARARRLKRQRGLDVLVVDYIQLLSGSTRRAQEGRVQEVTEITTSLKALAKELNVPILALSQLSRQVESRDDKRPQLSDLRESGSIEQDADVVLFVFREEYYVKAKEPQKTDDRGNDREEYLKWENEFREVQGKAEIIIAKQRHGPTGTVQLHFDGAFTRFANLRK
jgi:replicative DNA helicase